MIGDIDRRIERALAVLRLPFRGVFGVPEATGPVQIVDGAALAGEDIRKAELFQHYGLTSRPPAGFMGVLVPIGGKSSHGIIIATEHGQYRLKGLETGEVAIYSDEGDHVWLKRGRVIQVTTQTLKINASTKVEITTPEMLVTASTKVTFTTPLVQTSTAVTVGGILTAINGYALGGTLGGGQPSTFAGNIRHLVGNVEFCLASGTLTHGGTNVGKTHKHSTPSGDTSGVIG